LSIQIWDTGIGMAAEDLLVIFEEFRQLDNPTRERSRGLGLGLSIVQRLGNLLGHEISVRSELGKGSVFMIEVMLQSGEEVQHVGDKQHEVEDGIDKGHRRSGVIMVIEDDPEVCDLLGAVLKAEGHNTVTAHDGIAALELVAHGGVRPDLILADYGLPHGMNGLQATKELREKLSREVPLIILTGDVSTDALRDIAHQECVQLNKPVKLRELNHAIQRLLPIS
jgi:two-component system CheB/CheR fusion protein